MHNSEKESFFFGFSSSLCSTDACDACLFFELPEHSVAWIESYTLLTVLLF